MDFNTGAFLTAFLTVFAAVAAFFVAWLNNGSRLLRRIDELTTKVFALQDDVVRCDKERTELRQDVGSYQLRLERIENATGINPHQTNSPGIFIIGFDGVIREFSPSLSAILGWLPADMVGHSIEHLVPEEVLSEFRAMVEQATKVGVVIDPGKKVQTYLLDRKGRRVPVTITFRKWAVPDGIITATVKERPSATLIPDTGLTDPPLSPAAHT